MSMVLIFFMYSQNISALTPAADLTGQWSGFGQFVDSGGYCEISGKVNVEIQQDEDQIAGSFSFVQTNVKSNLEGLECGVEPIQSSFSGTLDGSRIVLTGEGITFSGWYASSGIKLDVVSDWFSGSTQLSPTYFPPPPFETKEEKHSENQQIVPEWIKNNAGWWANGEIDDSSFVQGIQYLIKEGIMTIPPTSQSTGTGANEIPSWIKNNAKWWSEGTITETDFIKGIEYMVKIGIIKIN